MKEEKKFNWKDDVHELEIITTVTITAEELVSDFTKLQDAIAKIDENLGKMNLEDAIKYFEKQKEEMKKLREAQAKSLEVVKEYYEKAKNHAKKEGPKEIKAIKTQEFSS